MKLLIHKGFEITHAKFYIISLILRPKNGETEHHSEVLTWWPHGATRGCQPLEDASHHACTKKLKCLVWIPMQQLGISQLQRKVKVSLLILYCS